MDFISFLDDIGYPKKLLDEVISNKNKYIYSFTFKGKWQLAPRWELKILQKILKNYLTNNYSISCVSEYATAYLKNKNISYNLDRHQGNSYFFVTDFKKFFPSITELETKTFLLEILKEKEESSTISLILEIIFYNGRLQYGFPTSPVISNIIMKDFDEKLSRELKNFFPDKNIQYSRYSDDITISTKYKIDKTSIQNIIKNLIDDSYSFLEINSKKTRYFEKYSNKPYITGLIPLLKRNSIGKKKYLKIKLNIHLLLENNDITNNGYKNIESLSSYLNYLYQVDKHNYIRLKKSFEKKYSINNNFIKIFKK